MQSIHPSPAVPAGHPDVTAALLYGAAHTCIMLPEHQQMRESRTPTGLLKLHVQLQEHRRRSIP